MLKTGIVGLPNAGKSTLFNALTRSHKAETANYPFCTIHPNLGVVNVPDARLAPLAKIYKTSNIIPATIEFVDIAGLVKGASHGEGLGNKFLSHIREVDAIIHAVRCFTDANVPHVAANLDPVRDIETVLTELVLADLEAVDRRHEKVGRDAKRGDKAALGEIEVLELLRPHLNAGKTALTLGLAPEQKHLLHDCFLLTDKPTLFVANVNDTDLAGADRHPLVTQIRDYARTQHECDTVIISAQIESDLAELNAAEATEFLRDLGVLESGVDTLIRTVYRLLNLRTFLTGNEKEVRAWTIHAGDTAPRAAGVVHSDFERGFIKAETVPFDDLIRSGSFAAAREQGHYRIEGREYVVRDGDVILFRFNV